MIVDIEVFEVFLIFRFFNGFKISDPERLPGLAPSEHLVHGPECALLRHDAPSPRKSSLPSLQV